MANSPGSIVYIRYLDHVLFKDRDPSPYVKPFVRETLGWVDHENNESIRLIWERFAEPNPRGEAQQRATGLLIMKKDILELRRITC